MEWDRISAEVHRSMKWMLREIWLVAAVFFVVFLIWSICNSAVESSQAFVDTLSKPSEMIFDVSVLEEGELQPAIKATPIIGREAVKRFRNHLDCFSESGKWVYDPTPRHIPWNYVGDVFTSSCEYRHLSSGSDHVADDLADDIALRGAPGNWSQSQVHVTEVGCTACILTNKVREDLKWKWQTNSSCPWRPINRDEFCRKIGAKGHVMLVGDSINHELQWSLMNALIINGSTGPVYERLDGSSRSVHGPYEMCSDIFGPGRGFNVSLVFNVHMTSIYELPDPLGVDYPWLNLLDEWDIKMLLMNTGIHHQDDETFSSRLREAFTILRERHPNVHVIFRNTANGHATCMNFAKPLSEPQQDSAEHAIQKQNYLARKIVEEFEYTYMDVYPMLSLRPEGHISEGDCLHYCLPSPLDIATEYLYNILLLV